MNTTDNFYAEMPSCPGCGSITHSSVEWDECQRIMHRGDARSINISATEQRKRDKIILERVASLDDEMLLRALQLRSPLGLLVVRALTDESGPNMSVGIRFVGSFLKVTALHKYAEWMLQQMFRMNHGWDNK